MLKMLARLETPEGEFAVVAGLMSALVITTGGMMALSRRITPVI